MKNLNMKKNVLFIILLFFIFQTGCSKKVTRTSVNNRTDPVENNNTVNIPLKYTGSYRIEITGFKGALNLMFDKKMGIYSGSILFDSWGKGLAEPLKNLRVKKNKIYFERSMTTQEELKKFGASRYFRHKYFGTFSSEGTEIKGELVEETGAITNWRGKR